MDDETRFLALASWRALLDRMLSFAMSSGDSIEADIRQLHALCEQQDQEAFLPLKPHEIAPEIPRRMLQFNRLVDDAVELARRARYRQYGQAERNAATSRLRPLPAFGQQGSRCLGGRVVRGRSHALGQVCRETPLWITFFYSDNWGDIITIDEVRNRLGEDIWGEHSKLDPVPSENGGRIPEGACRCCGTNG